MTKSGRNKKRITAVLVMVLVCAITSVYAVRVDVEGVKQGTDDKTYASDAPLATITIMQDVLNHPENATGEILCSYPGFRFVTLDYIKSKTYDSGCSSGLESSPKYPASTEYLVYDEEYGTRVSGVTGSMNEFTGDIASFTYPDGALLPDGTMGDVVITYSNIAFPQQSNFGQHRETNNYKAKVDDKYENFYTDAGPKIVTKGKLKGKISDYWSYDEEEDRGVYVGKGLYTVGVGCYLHTWNNLVHDMLNVNDTGYTTRNGLKADIHVQVVNKAGDAVDGEFFYFARDIDVSRIGNANFATLYDYANQNNYCETVRVNSGVAEDSEIYIPGDMDSVRSYKYTNVYRDSVGVVFQGKTSDPDPGTTYSGFVTLADNNQGMEISYWSAGAQNAVVRSFILSGHNFHQIKTSTGTGGTIKTTKQCNQTEDLSDADVLYSGTVEVADGKTVKYRITPEKSYSLSAMNVDGHHVSIPAEVGDETEIELSGTDEHRIGVLKKLENGEFLLTLPDNNADHEIHIDWESEHHFTKTWEIEEGESIPLKLNGYTYSSDGLALETTQNITINKSDVVRTTDSEGRVVWEIDINLPIEPDSDHDNDHINPLYWFAEENPMEDYETTYSNESAEPHYESADLTQTVRSKTDEAFISQKSYECGNILNVLDRTITLTVTKAVSGNFGDSSKTFPMTVAITNLEPNTVYGDKTSNANGELSIDIGLSDGGSWSIDLPAYAEATVTEAASNHIASYVANQKGEEIARDGNQIDSMPLATQNLVLKYDTTVSYTNEKNSAIPTGVPIGNTAVPTYVMVIVVLVGVMFAVMVIRKNRES